jgi:ribonuclease Z
MFGVTILGNNSALPAYDRHPTSQVVTIDDQLFLVDCGEGTQMQLARYNVRRGRINHIFLSHLHGDHYYGLPGLLNSMSLLNRTTALHLYAPAPLQEILRMQFAVADTELHYPLEFHALEKAGVVFESEKIRVSCFPTQHRIPCFGFRFDQIRAPRKINIEAAVANGIPANAFEKLKWGEDYVNQSGTRIPNALVTEKGPKGKSYAYCADTLYDESLIPFIDGCDLLYHETTYLKDLAEKAASRFHSTTIQAATLAKKANANRLLIGHFSSKYEKLEQFELESREVFPETDLALEGTTYRL